MKKIIGSVIIIIAIYLVYKYFVASPGTVLLAHHDAKTSETIKDDRLEEQSSTDFAFSLWYIVDDWEYNFSKKKYIFQRKSGGKSNPSVYFDTHKNDIVVNIATQGYTTVDNVTIINVPLQKWTNLIISVNDRVMDIYLDGKLVKTKILDGVPLSGANSDVLIAPPATTGGNPGFGGFISGFQHMGKSINPREAWNIYKKGYGEGSIFGKMLGSYGMRFSLLKNDKAVNELTI